MTGSWLIKFYSFRSRELTKWVLETCLFYRVHTDICLNIRMQDASRVSNHGITVDCIIIEFVKTSSIIECSLVCITAQYTI